MKGLATTIYKSGHLVQFTGTMPFHNTPHTPIPTRNIIEYRNQIPPHHNHTLQDISHLDHIPHIITNIEAGNCAVVTDGSFFPTTLKSAAAFVVGNEAAHRRVIGRCFVVGPQSSFSSYRAELAGIHGGLAFIQGLCESHQITTGIYGIVASLSRHCRVTVASLSRRFLHLPAVAQAPAR